MRFATYWETLYVFALRIQSGGETISSFYCSIARIVIAWQGVAEFDCGSAVAPAVAKTSVVSVSKFQRG